jgi:hypothetical protein
VVVHTCPSSKASTGVASSSVPVGCRSTFGACASSAVGGGLTRSDVGGWYRVVVVQT